MTRAALALILAGAPALQAARATDAPRTYAITSGSTLSYRLVHKFHHVKGISRSVEGRARVLPDGTVQAMVRARVDSFDSGNGNRDADMKGATDAARFPYVILKAVGASPSLAQRATAGTPLELVLRGELTFHGVTRPLEFPVKVSFGAGGRATAEATFPVSLEAHGVKRPSLLFVKVEDRIDVDASLALAEEGE